jgi:hypothetical protein
VKYLYPYRIEMSLTGLPQYLYLGQNERVEELNERILDRFHPDSLPNQVNSLEPNFSPRSVPTKYSLFPIIERRKQSIVPIQTLPNYSVETQFNPGYRGPVSGYMSNVDKETILRNQNFALQADIAQSTFIPSSQSDLYKTTIVSRPSTQPYPRLFENYKFDQKPHPIVSAYPEIGANLFFNGTRNQLRGIGDY